ncbi:hypothetical protein M8J75_010793 [Diaphorina citri]|nr:hypothetical protein M8J75_010793 [Diaphorina citri]
MESKLVTLLTARARTHNNSRKLSYTLTASNLTMEPCPPGREVTDFQFKLFSSVRVFPAIDYQNFFNNPSNTATASNKHGLLIVGTPTGFQIVNLAQFVSPNAAEFLNECTDYPRREYNINAQPSHIALNCDETLLSVAHQSSDNAPLVRIYKMASLTNQSKNKVVKIPLGPPGTCIMDFSWNPVIPDLLSVCVSNGCLCLYSHDDTGKKLTMLPPEKQVTCVSWSPKGKQLLAGDKYGNIVQYKPDLKEPQKIVPPPKDLFPNQCSIVNVIWLSVYQYGVIYVNIQSMETHFSIVNAPKSGPVRYVSYDEICFNSGTVRPHQFYLLHLSAWNILIVSSANSTEVSVLSLLDDKVSWEQWLQEDSTRIDLPIDKNKSETYPVGVTLASCSQLKIKWGENKFLEPMPTLSIVSNDGLVLLFHVINITPSAAQLCSPATPLPDHMFGTQAQAPNPPNQASVQTPPSNQTSVINIAQVSVASIPPPSFNIPNIKSSTQGHSPVLEISTNPNFSSGAPLSLFNKSQISITPVSAQVPKDTQPPPLSLFPQTQQPSVKTDNQTFQAKAQSIFQTVVQSNANKTPDIVQPPQPQPDTSPIPPTIVKTNLQKQQLIVEEKPEVPKTTPKQRTGTIKNEDLKVFLKLDESITNLLKSYKINIGSTELDGKLSKINDCVEKLENFFSQLEDTTKSLANDISNMKHSLNEAFVYAHESKDQLVKYERKKNHDKDPMEGIMITKKSMNPIVEKKLISIENEIRKSTYFVRSCIQESRPILQHLELVKSGKNVLNFQSILQSINKEKAMISRCSLMLDEINRDVVKMFTKQHILKCPRSSQKERVVLDKRTDKPAKPVDKFQAIKEQIKTRPTMSNEKMNRLKTLHVTQVLEPIRHSDLNLTSSKGLRSSDLLTLFKSPQKPQLVSQKSKDKSPPQLAVEKDAENKAATFTITTPVVSKTKPSVPTALFGNETKAIVVPSPVLCEKPEINKNTTAFIIDTSNTKANATKLTFDDSMVASAAFGKEMTKNLFTSTPAVTTATKMPNFAVPTPSIPNFGATFTKMPEPAKPQAVNTKPSLEFSIPTTSSAPTFSKNKTVKPPVSGAKTAELFSSGKPLFGAVTTTGTTTTPILSFGSSATTASGVNVTASLFGTTTKTSFPVSSVATAVSTSSTFSFVPSSTPKLSFGSSTFTVTTTASSTSPAPFNLSTKPAFGTVTTSTTSSSFTTSVSTPSFINTPAFSKPTTTTSSNMTFGFASLGTTKANTAKDTKTESSTSQSSTPKFEFGMTTSTTTKTTSEKKTSDREKSTDKKLEKISSNEHPLSAAPSEISISSLLASSSPVGSKNDAPIKTSSAATSIPLPSESKSVASTTTASAPTFSFGSSASMFGGGTVKTSTSSSFSFLNAASVSSATTTTSTDVTTTATTSSSSESVASIMSSLSSSSAVTGASSVSSIFSGTSKPSTSVFGIPTTSASIFTSPVTPTTTSSSESVVPKTPTSHPVSSDSTVITSSAIITPPLPPSTPTTNAPFSSPVLVTPTTTNAVAFPSTPTSTVSTGPMFGSPVISEAPAPQADIGNLFGQSLSFGSSSPAPQTSNVFGQSGGNLFSSSGSSSGGFGQSSGNIFAQKPSTQASTNLFGQGSPAGSGGSVFGQQTPSASGNVFAKSGNLFGDSSKTNTFGSPNQSPFGQQNTSSAGSFGNSSFGAGFGNTVKTESSSFFGQSTFGNTPTSSSSVFGAPTTSSSSVFGQSSPFGFGQSNASPSFANTSATSGFGAKATFGQTGGSIFGGKSSFGQSGGSIFGSTGSSPSGGSVFGGSISGGFGASSTFGQSASFGQTAPSAFGSSAFGAAPTFGSTPTFGGSPSFGSTSPNKIFGSTEPTAQQSAPSFGMGSGGSQLTFGNLAQQSPQSGFGSFGQTQASPPPAFGSQPGFPNPPQGGSSFSSWR